MATRNAKKLPDTEMKEKDIPTSEMKDRATPAVGMKDKEVPKAGDRKNFVVIGGEEIEIKPTKLKYQRNRTAAFYRLLDLYPLIDILAMDENSFGDGRDGDKALMDWLIAATDNEELIVNHYDDIDTETVEKILEIFKRLNRVVEKEEKLKNAERERKGAGG
jgi:hypothetical protein